METAVRKGHSIPSACLIYFLAVIVVNPSRCICVYTWIGCLFSIWQSFRLSLFLSAVPVAKILYYNIYTTDMQAKFVRFLDGHANCGEQKELQQQQQQHEQQQGKMAGFGEPRWVQNKNLLLYLPAFVVVSSLAYHFVCPCFIITFLLVSSRTT